MHPSLAHRGAKGLQASTGGAPISFSGITKRYGPVEALREFSLDIAGGEFVTFLGPSGSGKTTALNILAGFIEPSAGDVLIDGVSITRLPTEKRNVGMVFQSYSLFPHMDVRDNVAFPLRMRGVPKAERHARAEQALAMVRLAGFGGRKPHELSGGQRQRVACARAIVFEPRVLLMDEPLGALDLKLREAMQDEIKEVQRRIGCTVIYVTHDQGEALAMSDRIVVMSEGRIEQIGAPAAVYDSPSNAFVAQFVGETNFLPAELAGGGWLLRVRMYRHRRVCRKAGAGGWPCGRSISRGFRRPELRLRCQGGSATSPSMAAATAMSSRRNRPGA